MSEVSSVLSECIAHGRGGACWMREGKTCNIERGKRCSHFARVVLPKHPGHRAEYDALPMRGPDDTPEAVSGPRKPWLTFDDKQQPETRPEDRRPRRRRRGRPKGSSDSYRRERRPAKPLLGADERPRPERHCECGAVLAERQRVCERCKARRDRARSREKMRRWRKAKR